MRRGDCNLSGQLELTLRCKVEDAWCIVEYYLSVTVGGHAYDEVCMQCENVNQASLEFEGGLGLREGE